MSDSRSDDDGGSQSYSGDDEESEDSQGSGSYDSESDYSRNKRRRDRKADDKQKDKGGRKSREIIKIDSSDSEDSADYQKKRNKDAHSGDQRSKVTSQAKAIAHAVEKVKEIELKEFQKVVLRRSDLCKWVEDKDFQRGITHLGGTGGAFLRVRYADKYVIGQIDQIREGHDIYRVE